VRPRAPAPPSWRRAVLQTIRASASEPTPLQNLYGPLNTAQESRVILLEQMRRSVVIVAVLAALSTPAAVLAAERAGGDGTLVVKNGSAPTTVPVVSMKITGSVIGQVDQGKIVIDPGPNSDATPEVTGAEWTGSSKLSQTAQVWRGTQFKFRAVGGTFTILIYGTGVDLVAVGKGTVQLAGLPDTPHGDGVYSRNGADFMSLPGTQTDKLALGATG
jgi:hypothetical protein